MKILRYPGYALIVIAMLAFVFTYNFDESNAAHVKTSVIFNCIFLIIGIIMVGLSYKKKKLAEDYQTCLPSASGVKWMLSRRLNGRIDQDTRNYLTSLGFKILGLKDEMTYWVEPPTGYTKTLWEKDPSNRHALICDTTGKELFLYFESDPQSIYATSIIPLPLQGNQKELLMIRSS